MLGLMQDWPLTVHRIIDHAALCHADREVVTRSPDGTVERLTIRALAGRARKLRDALEARGINVGDRIATLAWNSARHIESWYGIAGCGAVYHTLNPRLHQDQIAWIAGHAEDRALFFDPGFAPLVAQMAPALKSVEFFVALTDREHLPDVELPGLVAYEDFIAPMSGDAPWKTFDENTACGLCYTSGTTGNSKGVLYSHRSNVLHAMMACWPDSLGFASADVVLPVVPMFHANGWGIPFAAPLVGAKLVLPGPRLDGPSLCALFEEEKVTVTAAVPTVWSAMLQYLEQSGKTLPHLKRVLIGGAACPASVIETFEQKYGVEVIHSWGMTETSPIGTIGKLKAKNAGLPYPQKLALKTKQGRPPFGIELKITDVEGRELPRDGHTQGRLKVRGPTVAKAYFRGESTTVFDADGWFDTGDVATLDEDSVMTITDRAKDVIKSGGEWISSIMIENLAMGHPAVAEAAVIGVRHPKWDERPLLIVVLKPGQTAGKKDILAHLAGRIAKWWLPDEVVFVESIPHSATGKIQKVVLRERFAGYRLPG